MSKILPNNPQYNTILRNNPHLQQIASASTLEERELNVKSLNVLERKLRDSDPELKYSKKKGEKSVNHWGQRKLLLSEIEFLTEYSSPGDIVVYVGAAPGTHIKWLSDLFPKLKFILYDPADFQIQSTDQITIHKQFFTDETAMLYTSGNILFICDIRTADYNLMKDEEVEEAVVKDQLMQLKWYQIMKPKYSMLKFRLPWGKGTTEYLDGKIFLPVWGRPTTTETRLVVARNAGIKIYDNTKYEEQMSYFNNITRVTYYERSQKFNLIGLDHCYDCSSEIVIVLNYIAKYCEWRDNKELHALIEFIINSNGKYSSANGERTLATHISDTSRQKWFTPRIYDTENKQIISVSPSSTSTSSGQTVSTGTREERTVRLSDLSQISQITK